MSAMKKRTAMIAGSTMLALGSLGASAGVASAAPDVVDIHTDPSFSSPVKETRHLDGIDATSLTANRDDNGVWVYTPRAGGGWAYDEYNNPWAI